MNRTRITGMIPAAIVPMREGRSIDFAALERYLQWLLSLGPQGIAVNVDTGESVYLTLEEQVEVIRVARHVASDGRIVVAGIAGPSTVAAVKNARAARDAGADALLVFPTPAFLNDPLDPRILVDYHHTIAEASGLPLIVFYLSPMFGGVLYSSTALAELLRLPDVVGLKEASFDAQRFLVTRDVVRQANHKVTLLTGNDTFLLESLLMGAEGGLLGFGAVGTAGLLAMQCAVERGDFEAALALQTRVQAFCDYIYRRPMGDYRARCKVALVHMGILDPGQTYVRLPYRSLWREEREAARDAVSRAGLLGVGGRVRELTDIGQERDAVRR